MYWYILPLSFQVIWENIFSHLTRTGSVLWLIIFDCLKWHILEADPSFITLGTRRSLRTFELLYNMPYESSMLVKASNFFKQFSVIMPSFSMTENNSKTKILPCSFSLKTVKSNQSIESINVSQSPLKTLLPNNFDVTLLNIIKARCSSWSVSIKWWKDIDLGTLTNKLFSITTIMFLRK